MKNLLKLGYYFSRILYIVIGLALCFSCTPIVDNETTGTITGIVADRTTGEPVSIVNVSIKPGGNASITGSDGTFSFKNLKEGDYEIFAEKEGYKSNSCVVYVPIGEASSVHLLIERIPAIVTADRDILDFGEDIDNNCLSFNIVNNYYEDLNWHVEQNCEWISSIEPETGTCKHGKTVSIVVNINRLYTKKGNNETKIVIISDNGNGSSEITLKAYNPLYATAKVETKAVTNIAKADATFNGEIKSQGSPAYTEKGFVYSTSASPTLSNTIRKITVNNSSYTFSAYVDGLELGVRYYVRAYVSHPLYIEYGDEVVFEPNDGYYKYGNLLVQVSDIGQGGIIAMNNACNDSRVGSMSGWRLPSLSELAYLYQNASRIGGFSSGIYWSNESSTNYKYTGNAGSPYTYYTTTYYYDFYYGKSGSIELKGSEYKWPNNSYYGRCVRNAN